MLLSNAEFCRDVGHFLELFEEAFGRRATKEYFLWRYANKTIDDFLPVNVLIENKKFVANYSANPIALAYKGADLPFLLSMTTMAHPLYEGRGLPAKLGNELYRWAGTKGVLGVIGFPNSKIHYIRRVKLGWEDIYEIPMLSLTEFPDGKSKSETISPSNDIDGEIDPPRWMSDFWHIKRTTDYLRWRYVENPVNDYRFWAIENGKSIRSYCVTKEYGDQVDVVDFVPETRHAAETMLRSLIDYTVARGFSQINAWVQPHMFFRGTFERYGFTNRAPVTYFGGRLFGETSGQIPDAGRWFSDYKSWFIQMGDSDVY